MNFENAGAPLAAALDAVLPDGWVLFLHSLVHASRNSGIWESPQQAAKRFGISQMASTRRAFCYLSFGWFCGSCINGGRGDFSSCDQFLFVAGISVTL
jgi:hypothetical protein